MFDNSDILNLQYFKRDSYISKKMSSHHILVEDRNLDAVAHLAKARSQNTEPTFRGYNKNEAVVKLSDCFFFCKGDTRFKVGGYDEKSI